ncbi:RNA polymerase sigma factor [Bacteroides ihuae]|uniref:RNA polymerase sigma factor n=1 Tax=Bacteroides ihuae TaxID=1852362 RepID=UPI0008DA76BC|nr:sigma-70 family RNA polymerase sigma factor [Bacteroides ihuae]
MKLDQPTMKTDQALLDKIEKKDEQAFSLFYKRHATFIAKRIRILARDEENANDIIQEFWLRFWEKPSVIKTNDKGMSFNFLYSFLFTFVLLMQRTHAKHEDRTVSLEELSMLPDTYQYSHVLEEVELDELKKFIDSLIDDLSPTDHVIYDMYQQNQPFEQIAQKVALSEDRVRNLFTRITQTLRKEIKEKYLSSLHLFLF